MKYLALIYGNEQTPEANDPSAMQALIAEYMAYEEWLAREHPGKKLAGEALQPTLTATTIKVRGGTRSITDGPFAETREQLGGFYMFEAKDLDEALRLAERIPDAKYGCVEVRPVMEIEEG